MSFFNAFFGGNELSSLKNFWKELTSVDDLEKSIEKSQDKIVVIFKHSTRCIISKTVLRNFENEIEKYNGDSFNFYYLDLLNHRDMSNRIAETLNVSHQSPQVIVLKDREVVYHASHENIKFNAILAL